MPTLTRQNIPPPKDWAEFEDITLTALKIRWQSPNLEKNGRQGQAQAGVDLWGPDNLERPVGVQCKLTSEELTFEDIEKEIAKAETFTPPMHAFYISTTAKIDAKLQAAVRTLSAQRVSQNKFPIGIIYWESLLSDLASNHVEFKKHFPHLYLAPVRPQAARLLSVLDIAYLGLHAKKYMRLLFGEFSSLHSEQPEMDRLLYAVRAAAPAVFAAPLASEMDKACRELRDAVWTAYSGHGDWTTAEALATRVEAIAEGAEYGLTSLELGIFTAGRMLGAWGFVEANNETLAEGELQELITLLKALFGGELPQDVSAHFAKYNTDPKTLGTIHIPHRIHQSLRQRLLLSELELS